MKIAEVAIKKMISLLMSGRSLSVSFSGGKDSHVVLILLLEALRRLVNQGQSVPKCYVVHAETGRDNPSIVNFMLGIWGDLGLFINKHNLPVEIVEVTPSITGRFTWTCLGRGKLPRYESSSSRDCAVDEKIQPLTREMKRITKETGGTIVSLLGTRFEESSARAASMNRYGMDEVTIVEDNGNFTFAPIAEWTLDEVWELIHGCTGQTPKLWSTFRRDCDELLTLYRDASEGMCAVIAGDDASSKKSCGSRFGCAWCTAVGGTDKSLESMISQDPERYGYMAGLVKFRRYLRAIRWDLNRRDWRGRKVSEAGFIKVTPDYFSPSVKLELLRYLITLDAKEVERAADMERRYYAGEVEKTPENWLLSAPMFQFIKHDDVAAIDFAWSVGRDFPTASVAAKSFIDIHDMGKRYETPEIEEFPRVTIPKVRWFDVNPAVSGLTGLASNVADAEDISSFSVSDVNRLTIEDYDGWEYLDDCRRSYHQLDMMAASCTAAMMLEREYVKGRKSDLERYQRLALRNDYLLQVWQSQHQRGEWIPMNQLLRMFSISDEEHAGLLKETERQKILDDSQGDLLGAESKLDMIEFDSPRKGRQRAPKSVKGTRVEAFYSAANQMALAI